MIGFISPERTISRVLPMARGSPATMPATMIMVMPLPMPRSVICSPSHMTNMVPVVMETVAMNRNWDPGFGTRLLPAFWMASAAPKPWNRGERHRAVARVLHQFAPAGLAVLADLVPRRIHHGGHLHDDRGRDVGHHVQGEDAESLQRTAREHVEHAEQRALLRRRRTCANFAASMPGTGNERADAIDHQRAQEKPQRLRISWKRVMSPKAVAALALEVAI